MKIQEKIKRISILWNLPMLNALPRNTVLSGLTIMVLLFLSHCGGGGGGDDDFIGAAQVQISASPSSIDTGDRTLVSTEISEIHENGIVLKYRYPEGLSYVSDSAKLIVNDREIDISPSVNAGSGSAIYLVFFLSKNQFGQDEQGEVQFQLEGGAEVVNGEIEADPDVDDPLIDNSTEFNIDNPEFVAEDSVEIEVVG